MADGKEDGTNGQDDDQFTGGPLESRKIRAMDERMDFRSVVIAALEAYLQTNVRLTKEGRNER